MASCYQSFRGIQISERQNPQQEMHIDLVAWHVGLTTSRQLCEDVLSLQDRLFEICAYVGQGA